MDISAGLPVGNNGLLDIALDPSFAVNRKIYFSYMEPGTAATPRIGRGAGDPSLFPEGLALASATLAMSGTVASLQDVKVL